MKITYPHTIENCVGEKIIFHSILQEPDGDRVIVENFVTPGHGPVMHTHFLQEEELTVIKEDLVTRFGDRKENMQMKEKLFCLSVALLIVFGMLAMKFLIAKAG